MKVPLEKTIERVKKMEAYFEMLSAFSEGACQNEEQAADLDEAVSELTAYLENGQWLLDYECDERGELPAHLKRGVLSQDGLYNLLSNIKIRHT